MAGFDGEGGGGIGCWLLGVMAFRLVRAQAYLAFEFLGGKVHSAFRCIQVFGLLALKAYSDSRPLGAFWLSASCL